MLLRYLTVLLYAVRPYNPVADLAELPIPLPSLFWVKKSQKEDKPVGQGKKKRPCHPFPFPPLSSRPGSAAVVIVTSQWNFTIKDFGSIVRHLGWQNTLSVCSICTIHKNKLYSSFYWFTIIFLREKTSKIITIILLPEIDPCNPNPCQNRGTCQLLPLNAYHCDCLIGWTGTNCDQGRKSFQIIRHCLMEGCLNSFFFCKHWASCLKVFFSESICVIKGYQVKTVRCSCRYSGMFQNSWRLRARSVSRKNGWLPL